jgi:hypothetical protein
MSDMSNRVVVKRERTPPNFSDLNIGDDVLYRAYYRPRGYSKLHTYYIDIKCRIIKINKWSMILEQYDCEIDMTDIELAIEEKRTGEMYFNWTDKLLGERLTIKTRPQAKSRSMSVENWYELYMTQSISEIDFREKKEYDQDKYEMKEIKSWLDDLISQIE